MGTGSSIHSNDEEETVGGRVASKRKGPKRDRRDPPQPYPGTFVFSSYGPDTESTIKPKADGDSDTKRPLQIVGVNFNIEQNVKEHHCDLYNITEETTDDDGVVRCPQLVIRRGQLFYITLHFDRCYDKDSDEIHVLFEIGPEPKESKGTLITLDEPGIKRGEWGFYVDSAKENDVTIAVQSAPKAIVGKWEFIAHTSLYVPPSAAFKEVYRYLYNQPVYLLFNPWCKEDTVYMEDEIMLDECILNDTGELYRGSHNQIGASPWNYGQFEDIILDCCMELLDKCVNYETRSKPIHVVRHISAVVNSHGDRGVLSGNWSGNYAKGTAPTAWVGSVAILEAYYKSKTPIKYGQCWVFSGVCTTFCRALGIPCRSVTNFASAHDCDDNITIDKHWDIDGKPMKDLNEDSVWNFHVWNEAWMARHDLTVGDYGGWQAFDATPQETSDGAYCAGPASVKAIKEGFLEPRYDSAFIYAEVNADRVHWKQQKNGKFIVMKVEKNVVGKNISTQKPRKESKGFINTVLSWISAEDSRLDITDNYKFEEGSEEERASIYRANANCKTKEAETYKPKGEPDMKFDLTYKDNILVGNPFNITLTMQNTSRGVRNISGSVKISPVFYTGVSTNNGKGMSDVKNQQFKVELNPVKNHEMVVRVSVDDYVNKFIDQVAFEIYVSAEVEETSQVYYAIETYRLRRPDLQLKAPKEGKVGETVQVKVYLLNPLPLTLTDCEWDIEGPGISKSKKIQQKDIDPNDQVEISVDVTPKRPGDKKIMASFTSKQLTDVTGSCSISIDK